MGGIEYTVVKKDGTRVPVMLHARPIIKNGRPLGTRGVIVDISRLKENEQKLRFLSYHDPLTGLYNRHFFEQKMHELDGSHQMAAIILCDVDGLKVVNDTMGHATGDKLLVTTAGIIARSFRKQDIIARIGGDEFAVLLTDVDLATVQRGMRRIAGAVNRYNNQAGEHIPLSLSTGMAYNLHSPVKAWELFKEADNNMYRKKLYHGQDTRGVIMQSLMRALKTSKE
jgi:diguanylate cyclase (GGDEF)-like protein